MNFPQNSDYTVVSNNEAASIICRFTPTMIEDIVSEALRDNFKNYSLTSYNLIESLESNYRVAASGLQEYSKEILMDRHDNYIRIINMVCNAYGLSYTYDENQDIYSVATNIYNLLISQFNVYIIAFFVNYINKNKDMIYENLDLESKKKDISPYSKKIFKMDTSNRLATIHANLEFVLENILSYDIDFGQYLFFACSPDIIKAQYLQSILVDTGDFMKRIIAPYFNNNPILITQIKFALQGVPDPELNSVL